MPDKLNKESQLEVITGLSTEAFQTYKHILISPPTSISKMAKSLGLSRAGLYNILAELQKEKLITKTPNHPNNYKFIAASPDLLLKYAQQQQEQLNQTFSEFQLQVNFLKATREVKDRTQPSIEIIQGKQSNDQLNRIILKTGKPVLGFTYMYHLESCFDFDKEGNLIHNDYLAVVLSVTNKLVFPGTKSNIDRVKTFLKNNPHLKGKWFPRWLPKEKFEFKINFYCFEDTVAFELGNHKDKDYLAYMINNQEIALSIKSLVEYTWETAQPI